MTPGQGFLHLRSHLGGPQATPVPGTGRLVFEKDAHLHPLPRGHSEEERPVSTRVFQRISECQGNVFHQDGEEEKRSFKKEQICQQSFPVSCCFLPERGGCGNLC